MISLILCQYTIPEYWEYSVPTRGSYITRYFQFWSKPDVRTSRAVENIEVIIIIITLLATSGTVLMLQQGHERGSQLWTE